jgi:hypothetical protein
MHHVKEDLKPIKYDPSQDYSLNGVFNFIGTVDQYHKLSSKKGKPQLLRQYDLQKNKVRAGWLQAI